MNKKEIIVNSVEEMSNFKDFKRLWSIEGLEDGRFKICYE